MNTDSTHIARLDIYKNIINKIAIMHNHEEFLINYKTKNIIYYSGNSNSVYNIVDKESYRDIDCIFNKIDEFERFQLKNMYYASKSLISFNQNNYGNLFFYFCFHLKKENKKRILIQAKIAYLDENICLCSLVPAPHNNFGYGFCWDADGNKLYYFSFKGLRYHEVKHHLLTKQQIEIIILLGNGLKKQDVAERMFLSIDTINYHIKEIKNKLKVKSIIEANNLFLSYIFV